MIELIGGIILYLVIGLFVTIRLAKWVAEPMHGNNSEDAITVGMFFVIGWVGWPLIIVTWAFGFLGRFILRKMDKT